MAQFSIKTFAQPGKIQLGDWQMISDQTRMGMGNDFQVIGRCVEIGQQSSDHFIDITFRSFDDHEWNETSLRLYRSAGQAYVRIKVECA